MEVLPHAVLDHCVLHGRRHCPCYGMIPSLYSALCPLHARPNAPDTQPALRFIRIAPITPPPPTIGTLVQNGPHAFQNRCSSRRVSEVHVPVATRSWLRSMVAERKESGSGVGVEDAKRVGAARVV